jgi:hypothetical protein
LLVYSANETQPFRVDIVANVVGQYSVAASPAHIDLGRVGSWEKPERIVKFSARGTNALTINEISPDTLRRQLSFSTERVSKELLQCRVKLEDPGATGEHNDALQVITTAGTCTLDLCWNRIPGKAYSTLPVVVWNKELGPKEFVVRCESDVHVTGIDARSSQLDIKAQLISSSIEEQTRVNKVRLTLLAIPSELPHSSDVELRLKESNVSVPIRVVVLQSQEQNVSFNGRGL